MSASEPRSPCPIAFALDVFGDRWSLLIIRDLAFMGRSTYGEFLRAGEGISTNVLADRLKRLERDGVIVRDNDGPGARHRYRLSDQGIELVPVLISMIRWSARHDPATPLSEPFRRRLEEEPEALAAELMERARAFRDRETDEPQGVSDVVDEHRRPRR